MSRQLRVLREFGLQLKTLEPQESAVVARGAGRQRRALVVADVVALALATAGLAAAGVFSTGAPVKPAAKDLITPRGGNGAVITGTVGPIVATSADPAGGPRWGIRALKTTRGLGCLQVGRVVGGRLGVLGADGAFADDGRFHPLPPQVNQTPVDCSTLDARGQLFLAFESQDVPASGDPTGCTHPGNVQPHPKPAICPQGDERAIYAGLLGPSAASITYTDPRGSERTNPTGPDGAYLIVTLADPRIRGGANFGGVLPSAGNGDPITAITYRNGQRCILATGAATNSAGGLCVPVGYLAPHTPSPSPRALATPIHHALRIDTSIDGHRADALLISFTAKFAVKSASSAYTLRLQLPNSGTCSGNITGTMTTTDIAAGSKAELKLVYAHPAGLLHCPGIYHATVYYLQSTTTSTIAGPQAPAPNGTEPPGVTATVIGRFTFRGHAA